jgi:hypothetical protein
MGDPLFEYPAILSAKPPEVQVSSSVTIENTDNSLNRWGLGQRELRQLSEGRKNEK